MKFNRSMLEKAIQRKKRDKHLSDNKHIELAENVLMELVDHCEPLVSEQIDELLKMTEYSRFNNLRVKLLEKK